MKDPNWAHRVDWGKLERERAERCRKILDELAEQNRLYERVFVEQTKADHACEK